MAYSGDDPKILEKLKNDPSFFPIGVWLQSPHLLDQYRDIGVNVFVGLNGGPTVHDFERFEKAGAYIIGDRVPTVPIQYSANTILAWRVKDEPDNAKRRPDGSMGPCLSPQELHGQRTKLKSLDSRPVFINFGRGVADMDWKGRGECRGKTEDYYPDAIAAADIVSFDIYPLWAYDGKLELVAQGVRNLKRWSEQSDAARPIWNVIGASPIRKGPMPTKAQLHSQVWMSIINGSRGIIYFPWLVDENGKRVREDYLFEHPDVVQAVKEINLEIQSFAEIVKTGTLSKTVKASAADNHPFSMLALEKDEATYIFLVSETAKPSTIAINMGASDNIRIMDLRTDMEVTPANDGTLTIDVRPYGVRFFKKISTMKQSNLTG